MMSDGLKIEDMILRTRSRYNKYSFSRSPKEDDVKRPASQKKMNKALIEKRR